MVDVFLRLLGDTKRLHKPNRRTDGMYDSKTHIIYILLFGRVIDLSRKVEHLRIQA